MLLPSHLSRLEFGSQVRLRVGRVHIFISEANVTTE